MKQLFFTLLCTMLCIHGQSQGCRYLEEVFPAVKRTGDITYGVNATVLYAPGFGEAVPEELLLDLYEPEGDTEGERPLIIYFHSGNFLPFPQNQSIVGTRRDSASVEICRRLARSGYVVASADYRLGWNPLATNQTTLTIGLINAAYRGVQDANTCIRYFKKTFNEQGNPYRIDPCRIVLFGDDTGGYLSVNAGALDRYSKIPETPQYNFTPDGINFFPMVLEHVSGNVEAMQYGTNVQPTFFPFPIGDTLCYPDHVEYSSHFNVAVNLAGAVGDSTWIEAGQPPIISVGTKYDQTTPYGCGIVFLQTIPVIDVCGPHGIAYQSNLVGNNAVLTPSTYCNDFQAQVTAVALSRNDGLEGLLPIIGDTITDYNPWNFWDCSSNPNCAVGLKDNPHMSREKAEKYIDTILAYVQPRLFQVLDFSHPVENCLVLETKVLPYESVDILLYPNPANQEVIVTTPPDHIIRNLRLYDATGRLIQSYTGIDESHYQFPISNFIPGLYLLQIEFDQGVTARQFVVK